MAERSSGVRLQHPFELGPIELGDATGVRGAEHRLERLASQPEHQSQNSGGTGEKNVLHAD